MEAFDFKDLYEKRFFPTISEEEKNEFIVQTNELAGIKITKEEIYNSVMSPQKSLPAISGHIRSIGLLEDLAKQIYLIPKPEKINEANISKQISWLFIFHGNILYDFAVKGSLLNDSITYPSKEELGQYRNIDRVAGLKKIVRPDDIKKFLVEAAKEYSQIYYSLCENISFPSSMEEGDWAKLERATENFALHIICIRPFNRANGRVARISENLLRLNSGLRFQRTKITSSKIQSFFENNYQNRI